MLEPWTLQKIKKNVLTNIKEIVKKVKRRSPQTKVVFSGLTVQKDKVSIYKDVRVAYTTD